MTIRIKVLPVCLNVSVAELCIPGVKHVWNVPIRWLRAEVAAESKLTFESIVWLQNSEYDCFSPLYDLKSRLNI